MTFPASRRRAGCPVCGTAHAACGPPVAAEAAERAVDEPTMLVRSGSRMAEEETQDQPEQLKRYRVRLDGNRGETTMKLTEKDAEAMGDRVLEDLGDAKMYGMPENQTKFSDQTASDDGSQAAKDPAEEESAKKARTASNKKKSPTDK